MNINNRSTSSSAARGVTERLLDAVRHENSELRRSVSTLTRTVDSVTREKEEAKKMLSKVEAELKFAQEKIASLTKKVEVMAASIADLTAKKNRKDKKNEQVSASDTDTAPQESK